VIRRKPRSYALLQLFDLEIQFDHLSLYYLFLTAFLVFHCHLLILVKALLCIPQTEAGTVNVCGDFFDRISIDMTAKDHHDITGMLAALERRPCGSAGQG
jgi:hypothetical protein